MIEISRLTTAIFLVNAALDEGKTCSIDSVQDAIQDGTIFSFLTRELGSDPLSLMDKATDRDELLDLWRGLVDHCDEARKMGVRKNGFCLVLAYLVEAIQQFTRETSARRA